MNENMMTGAEIHAGDGEYQIGTQEKYEAFVAKRNQGNKMNEKKVKELLVQAGVYDCEPDDPNLKIEDIDKEYLTLIELVVRECTRVCLDQRDPPNLNYKPSERFAEAIKEHFGI